MRVLLVGDYPPPQGGIAIHVKQVHDFLRERGVPASVLDIGKGGQAAPDVLAAREPRRYVLELARFLRAGWTVHVHTSGNNPKSWLVAASAGVPGPTSPRLITLHSGLLPDYLGASVARRALARAALSGYAAVVAVSGAVRTALLEAGVPAAKVHVHPAFLASQVRPGALPEAARQARERRRPLLAMAHHPSPVYGRRLMLEALALLAARHPGVGLALFGPGTRTEDFARDVRAARVDALVEDLGELSHPEALALIQAADAFVRPTTHDGDALSVREALTLGTPCVASDVCARPEGCATFRAGDAAALARALEEALARAPSRVVSPDAGPFLLSLYARAAAGATLAAPAPTL